MVVQAERGWSQSLAIQLIQSQLGHTMRFLKHCHITTYSQTQYYHLIYALPSQGFLLISPKCDLVFLTGKHGRGRDFDMAGLFSHIRTVLILVRGTIKEGDTSRQGWCNSEAIQDENSKRERTGKKSCKICCWKQLFPKTKAVMLDSQAEDLGLHLTLFLSNRYFSHLYTAPGHFSVSWASTDASSYGFLIPFGNIYQRLILSPALLSERIKYGGRPDIDI